MTKGITITIVASMFAIVLVGLLASSNGATGAVTRDNTIVCASPSFQMADGRIVRVDCVYIQPVPESAAKAVQNNPNAVTQDTRAVFSDGIKFYDCFPTGFNFPQVSTGESVLGTDCTFSP